MKMRLHRIVLAFMLLNQVVAAQPQDYSKTEIDRMILAYTFYLKQKVSLEVIAEKFPFLKSNVDNITNDWNREFISSVKNIDSVLTNTLKEEWSKDKAFIMNKFTRADYADVTESGARQYIDFVNEGTVGRMQSPILETFLIWNPLYQKFPEMEFNDGYVNSFFTNNLRETVPINVKVLYPRSWKAEPGKKNTNVMQKFTSGLGAGSLTMLMIIEKFEKDFSKETIKQLLSKENLQKGLPANDKILNYKPKLLIDNCPGAAITTYHEEINKDFDKTVISAKYSTYYKNYNIIMNFVVTSTASSEDNIKFTYEKHQKLFKKIIDNMVILSRRGL